MRTKEIESYTYYVIMTLNMEKREQSRNKGCKGLNCD